MFGKTEIRRSKRTQITSVKLSDLITDTNAYKSDFFKKAALVRSNPFLPETLFTSGAFLPIGAPRTTSLDPVLHDLASKARQETNGRYQAVIELYSQQHEHEKSERTLHQLIKAHYLYAEHLFVLVSFYSNSLIQSHEPKYINKVSLAEKKEYRQHVENYSAELFDQMNFILQQCDAESEEHHIATNIKETYTTAMDEINTRLPNNKKRKNTEYLATIKLMKPASIEQEKDVKDDENQLKMSR